MMIGKILADLRVFLPDIMKAPCAVVALTDSMWRNSYVVKTILLLLQVDA
jgi:hypothetical protein